MRALDALDLGTPRPEVIRLFGVSTATLTRWRRRQRETGSLAESPRSGPPAVKTAGLSSALLGRLEAQPDATLEEHCQWTRPRPDPFATSPRPDTPRTITLQIPPGIAFDQLW